MGNVTQSQLNSAMSNHEDDHHSIVKLNDGTPITATRCKDLDKIMNLLPEDDFSKTMTGPDGKQVPDMRSVSDDYRKAMCGCSSFSVQPHHSTDEFNICMNPEKSMERGLTCMNNKNNDSSSNGGGQNPFTDSFLDARINDPNTSSQCKNFFQSVKFGKQWNAASLAKGEELKVGWIPK